MAGQEIGPTEVRRRFRPRTPDAIEQQTIKEIEDLFVETGHHLAAVVPDGREKSLGFTALEDAKMWLTKAVANGSP